MTLFEKAIVIAKVVNTRLIYQDELINFKQAEYWAKPIEIHNNILDDCDGYSCLICYLLRLFGAKDYEVFVRAGNIIDNNKIIGHATCLFFDVDTFLFYPLEGSFYAEESIRNFGKVPLFLNPKYKDTWWITNDVYSYSTIPFLRFIR